VRNGKMETSWFIMIRHPLTVKCIKWFMAKNKIAAVTDPPDLAPHDFLVSKNETEAQRKEI